MPLSLDTDVLLFFEDVDRDTFVRNDRRLRRLLRKGSYLFRRGRPKVSGFELWFLLLKAALERSGSRVHCNDERLARKNPHFPVGLVGYPHILEGWSLPNPAVLGPGIIDHPAVAPNLMKDPRFKVFIATCDWYADMFAPYYGADRLALWHAGIDLEEWPDLSQRTKDVDVLIYDKVRWHRDLHEPGLLATIDRTLRARGLRRELIRYGQYDYQAYRALLARSRALIFVCEHETQGMAYQEAMASGVPVLAWDPGYWIDPQAKRHDPNPIPATSVPYFSPECGERFRDEAAFPEAFGRFWSRLAAFAPRDYVQRELSLEGSARLYMQHLRTAAGIAANFSRDPADGA
jgi:hypothetical protein